MKFYIILRLETHLTFDMIIVSEIINLIFNDDFFEFCITAAARAAIIPVWTENFPKYSPRRLLIFWIIVTFEAARAVTFLVGTGNQPKHSMRSAVIFFECLHYRNCRSSQHSGRNQKPANTLHEESSDFFERLHYRSCRSTRNSGTNQKPAKILQEELHYTYTCKMPSKAALERCIECQSNFRFSRIA